MKIEGYMDLTIQEVKEILKDFAINQGYDATEVSFPTQLNNNSIISISIEVKSKKK